MFHYTAFKHSYAGKITKAIIALAGFLATLTILIITFSRTAILMYLGFVVYLLYKWFKNKSNHSNISAKRIRTVIPVVTSLLFAGMAILLFNVKQQSSAGRLTVWRIAIPQLFDNHFTGIGIGNFAVQYPKWQMEYVASHSLPATTLLNMDETHVAFNEYLQLFLETGIVGFPVFTICLVALFKTKSNDKPEILLSVKATMLLILIAACFSYPLRTNAILFIFTVCTSLLFSLHQKQYRVHSYSLKLLGLGAVTVLLLLNLNLSYNMYGTVKQWDAVRVEYAMNGNDKQKAYKSLYPKLKTQGKFLLDYGEYLKTIGKSRQATMMMKASQSFYVSERTFIPAANASILSGDTTGAIENTRKQTLLIPFKFTPRWKFRWYLPQFFVSCYVVFTW